MKRDVFLIAGPTASGKTEHAITLATSVGAAIINADSMQVYDILRIVTARPTPDEEARAPHHLFGHIHPSETYSTGQWIADVAQIMQSFPHDQPLIFVGGTGLYFRALLDGLSPMPTIPDTVRQRWRYRLHEEGASKLHRQLRSVDPEAAMRLRPNDGQRIARALEVLEASGKSLLWWQKQNSKGLIDTAQCKQTILLPDRSKLHERINKRFQAMMELGAINEVKTLLALQLPASQPAMKAIGVREIAAMLDGQLTREQAIEKAQAASRQYAKRQMTWFRQQMDANWQRQDPFNPEIRL